MVGEVEVHRTAEQCHLRAATTDSEIGVNSHSCYDIRMTRTVTLTDTTGKSLGQADLMEAHTGEGKLHRAFSVYVFDKERKHLLIQRRSSTKMLWPLFWANTCCSHPFENESPRTAGERRLQEEMGFTVELHEGPAFTYCALDPAGRGIEHEYVTILVGLVDPQIAVHPDPKEVDEWKWIELPALETDLKEHPDLYTPWFHIGLKKLLD